MGAYTVRPGDTLAGIAARSGVAASQIAWMNGLRVGSVLPAGMALKLPTGSPATARRATPSTAPRVVPHAAPYATGTHVTAGTVGSIASAQGVPASLATAVAYQESGFNNGAVSSANARGVMQVMPGTWSYIQNNLGVGPLNPLSAADNVRAGSAYLRDLLRQTGGNVSQAVAGYYQGLGSVRQVGMYADTQRYVANVLALRARFGR
jgi:soluble lytic murein transglycosylase-like protein